MPAIETGSLLVGERDDCRSFISSRTGYYVYILRRPDGRPFYVGKGKGDRVFSHENEATHPNDHRSNAYKLNVIRSIRSKGMAVTYEIDLVADREEEAYEREATLISDIGRLHEGGPLTNLAPGGGTNAGPAPASRARHARTLSGAPDDNPERAVLNTFVLGIADMNSVVVKPVGQFTPKPTEPFARNSRKPSLRQATALVASAAANGISLDTSCVIPRKLEVQGVTGLIENGVSRDIATSGMAQIVPTSEPADECFDLSRDQCRQVVGIVGRRKCYDLGIISSIAAI